MFYLHQNEYLIYYINQSQSILKFLFSAVSISVIPLCWNIKQVSSAYTNSSQSKLVAYYLYIKEKEVVLKWIFQELLIGGFEVRRKYS